MALESYASMMSNSAYSADALREISSEAQERCRIDTVWFTQTIERTTEIRLQAIAPLFAWKFTFQVHEPFGNHSVERGLCRQIMVTRASHTVDSERMFGERKDV